MTDISRSIVFPSSDTKDTFNTSGGLESGVRWSVLDAVSVNSVVPANSVVGWKVQVEILNRK